jgi:2-polyprenyl-3-methyl-5-hydroxy-6-metoxy-1,4-benzoquinol methylase
MNDSRFFRVDDPKTEHFVYDLPEGWWSRFYEYEWCKNFVEAGDAVLDAASGVFHPLKYYLAEHCKEVYACDIDKNIALRFEQMQDIPAEFKDKINILSPLQDKINNCCCSLASLPYKNNMFDKIFCISVFEHLPDFRNTFGKIRGGGGYQTNLEIGWQKSYV